MPFPEMNQVERDAYNKALRKIEECQRTGGTVLNLREMGLTHHPPEIGQLTALRWLYLHDNPELGIPESVLAPRWQDTFEKNPPAPPAAILDHYFRSQRLWGRS